MWLRFEFIKKVSPGDRLETHKRAHTTTQLVVFGPCLCETFKVNVMKWCVFLETFLQEYYF